MPPIISPIESLGLAGAALEGRVRRAANHVGDRTLARIAERLSEHAVANEVVYERDGKFEPIRIMLRPLLAMGEQLSYVHFTCLQLIETLKRLPQLYLDDADVRRVLAITPGEESWLRDTWTPAHGKANSVYGRLDAVCDFRAQAWQETLQFMEANLSGVGGIHYSPLAEQLVHDDIVPTLLAHDPGLRIELPRDQRDLFVQVLIDHARTIGRSNCRLCFVEPKYAEDGIAEQSVLSKYLGARHNLSIAHADPRELRIKGDEVFYEDECIDVAYRDYETRDLLELEEELGKPLDAMRLLFRSNRMVSSIVGDFDHKSCWEILTDPALAERFFNIEECRLFRRHVLWTRVVRPRKTTLPHNIEGDLLEYARTHREQLVLKPNRSYGGDGVTIGAATEQGAWERLLNEASAKGDDTRLSWVVQSATRLPVYDFPIVGEGGRVFSEPFYTVMGFAPTENGLGTMCRVSQKQVVNVAQHGGMAALLVAHPPGDLRVPKRSAKRADGAEQALRSKIAELRHLKDAISLLEWDENTVLANGARSGRADQLATLEGLLHGLLISDHLGDLIAEVSDSADERWTRELELLTRQRRRELALPEELVRRFAKARSLSQAAWETAREKSDFSLFCPALEETLTLVREMAAPRGPGNPYDALLDEYEPGLTTSRIEPVLTDLRAKLSPMVKDAARGAGSAKFPKTLISRERQWELSRFLLEAMAFDFNRGQLGRTAHPATTWAGFDDVRVAIRKQDRDLDLIPNVLTALHEGGHALYDQGFASSDRDSLIGDAPSMGLHEAQARLWENHVGRSPAFWTWFAPKLQSMFEGELKGIDANTVASINRIEPGPIRVTSDEVSYHLHIVLRYELEVALITGALRPKYLPGAWRERSAALLGVTPSSDREGVLQDSHWAAGMFGYFPTYTIGSLYAAQLIETYERDHALAGEIGRGAFTPLLTWLRAKVHAVGNRFPAEELISQITGKGLDTAAYFAHVERRFAR